MIEMRKCILSYLCFLMLLLVGCSSSHQRVNKAGGADSMRFEKRVDDLSGKINLIVNDTNTLHNEVDDVKESNKTMQQKIEGLEATINNLNKQIGGLTASVKMKEVTPLSDEETGDVESLLAVAKGFWTAMNKKDIQTARSYATKESGDKLQMKDTDAAANCTVTLGEVRAEEDKAAIETVLLPHEGPTISEVQMQTILVKEDGQWKVDAEQTMRPLLRSGIDEVVQGFGKAKEEVPREGMEGMGRSATEDIQKGIAEMTLTDTAKPDSTLPQQEKAVVSEQNEAEGIQINPEEKKQTSEEKPGITPPKPEASGISEPAGREVFLKDNIARLAEAEFPDNKGIQWNILSIEHKAHLANVEAEPVPPTLAYPRYKFVISFKDQKTPRIIGIFCYKDGQYSPLSTKKK